MTQYEKDLEYLLWLERRDKVPYDLKITTIPERKTTQYKIKELKEMKQILEQYKNQTIEVDLKKVGKSK
jgi:hypothetical protein